MYNAVHSTKQTRKKEDGRVGTELFCTVSAWRNRPVLRDLESEIGRHAAELPSQFVSERQAEYYLEEQHSNCEEGSHSLARRQLRTFLPSNTAVNWSSQLFTNMTPTVKLNNNYDFPVIGLGTYNVSITFNGQITFSLCMSITITILNIIHRPDFHLKICDLSETGLSYVFRWILLRWVQ
jgi:hypothetical protein